MENMQQDITEMGGHQVEMPQIPSSFRAIYYIRQGFRMFTAEAGAYIAITFLLFVGLFLVGMLPYVGDILSSLIIGPLMIGFGIYAMATEDNAYRGVRTFFEEFKERSLYQYFFFQYFSKAVSLLFFIGSIYLFIGDDLPIFLEQLSNLEKMEQEEAVKVVEQLIQYGPLQLGALAGAILVSLFTVLLTFTGFYIWRARINFWQAMKASAQFVLKNFAGVIFFLLLMGLLSVFSVLLMFLGFLVVLPVYQLALFRAFRDFHPELFHSSH